MSTTSIDHIPLVGLIGPKGSGKTALARILEREHGYRRLPLAGPVKQEAMRRILAHVGLPTADALVYGDRKEEVVPGLGLTSRVLQQQIGDEMRADEPDILLRLLAEGLAKACRENTPVVVDDIRFVTEAAWLRARNALLVSVRRPGIGYTGEHVTEDARIEPEAAFYVENRDLRDAFDQLWKTMRLCPVVDGQRYRLKERMTGWWAHYVGRQFCPYDVTVDGMMCDGYLQYGDTDVENQFVANMVEGVRTYRLEEINGTTD